MTQAVYKKFKLPPLRYTQCSPGSTSTSLIGRRSRYTCGSTCKSEDENVSSGDHDLTEDFDDEPTAYEIERQSATIKWKELRGKFLTVSVECASLPDNQICISCAELATLRCLECGPKVYYCKDCFYKYHEKINQFHVAEKWEGDHYSANRSTKVVNVVQPHGCTLKPINLLCIDDKGMEHPLTFMCCDCEPLPLTLIRANLWPASPSFPTVVFTFELLDWAEALMLECQVALKDFCKALSFRCRYKLDTRRNIYSALIDAFEEYRTFKHEIRHLNFLSTTLDEGNICPACPKGNDVGNIVLSIDGLFGLPRKKSAGTSYLEAAHGKLFFCDQTQVDTYVAESTSAGSKNKSMKTECNEFLAGNMLRSACRYHKLDETALFGSVCRHEFPLMFLNLKHGERLAYGVFLIDSLLEKYVSQSVLVMYDVACTLQKHLKLCGRDDILEKVCLCLPSFHSYGHKASCQLVYGPLRCEGIGLSDGEGMERLWSFLRRFSRMTKEMRPAHRINVLSHALVYYGMHKKETLCKSLLIRWKRAKEMHCVSQQTFLKLCGTRDNDIVSEEVVHRWVCEEKSMSMSDQHQFAFGTLPQWKCEYFLLLNPFFHWSDQIKDGRLSANERLHAKHEIMRLDGLLKEVERKHRLTCRWSPHDQEYTQVHDKFTQERGEQIGQIIWSASSTRQFLLNLKAKYADGQKVAKKLSLQITKETKNIRALLPEYNACQLAAGVTDTLDIKQALDCSLMAKLIQPRFSLAYGHKRDLVDAYIMMKRSSEEIEMLESEMENTMQYYTSRQQSLKDTISVFSSKDDMFARGAVAMLQFMKAKVDNRVLLCQKMLSTIKHPTSFLSADSDVYLDTESESELAMSSDSDIESYSSDED